MALAWLWLVTVKVAKGKVRTIAGYRSARVALHWQRHSLGAEREVPGDRLRQSSPNIVPS
jgi:hypothetical protein